MIVVKSLESLNNLNKNNSMNHTYSILINLPLPLKATSFLSFAADRYSNCQCVHSSMTSIGCKFPKINRILGL